MISLPAGSRIWLVAGITENRVRDLLPWKVDLSSQ